MEAYVTLVATDSYASGALVLAHILRDLGSKKDIVCLVTPNISSRVQDILSKICTVIQVDTIRSKDYENLKLLGRPELDITFTKIQLWKLTQYKKVVFLDADTYPIQNIDQLFEKPSFSAAPDAGWPDCFNSGVFVTEPSDVIYDELCQLAVDKGSFDGGDQGLLNSFFDSWSTSPAHRLPFTFNTTPTSQYGYAPAQNKFGQNISVIHFIGENKPWKYQRFADGRILPLGSTWEGAKHFIQAWWNTWDTYYGQTSPYHLLSGEFVNKFDDGFQTCPIVPFDESIRNAWANQEIDLNDYRKQIQPMPPISSITIGQPDWLIKETERRKQLEEQAQARHRDEQDQARRKKEERRYQEEEKARREDQEQRDQESKEYSMIEWDPAYQEPPNTGRPGAGIPDLSSFRNVWDRPRNEQANRWVIPEHHPESQIMTKPEYSHYNAHEYAPFIHQYDPPSFPWDNELNYFPPSTRVCQEESGPNHYDDIRFEKHATPSSSSQEHVQTSIQPPPETPSEKEHTESPLIRQHEPTFAIDAMMSPAVQSKVDEFIASLNEEQDQEVSDRDLIPIKFKPTSRLTGMYTPSPIGSRAGSRSNSRNGSRRASVSNSRRNSVISINKSLSSASTTEITDVSIVAPTFAVSADDETTTQQSQKLFAASSSMFSHKTPYTSAAATPAIDEFAAEGYFDDQGEGQEEQVFTLKSDFLNEALYSLNESLVETAHADEWNTLNALNKLKEHSESMVLRQSLQEALVETAKNQQQKDEAALTTDEPIATVATPDIPINNTNEKKYAFRSTWDDEEYGSPSAFVSGETSPRTPIARSMSYSDLTKEIELEKERYKQQRASLMLAEPRAAFASMLEAELDLSHGTLFKRRYHEATDDQFNIANSSELATKETTGILEMKCDEEKSPVECVAYYDDHVIREAQKRLRALVTGEEVDTTSVMPEPLERPKIDNITSRRTTHMYQHGDAKDPQTFSLLWNSTSYTSNFGFDNKHKLPIYQSDLIPTDDIAKEIKSLSTEIVVKEDAYRLAKEDEEFKLQAEPNLLSEMKLKEEERAEIGIEDVNMRLNSIKIQSNLDETNELTKSDNTNVSESSAVLDITTRASKEDLDKSASPTKDSARVIVDNKSLIKSSNSAVFADKTHNEVKTLKTKDVNTDMIPIKASIHTHEMIEKKPSITHRESATSSSSSISSSSTSRQSFTSHTSTSTTTTKTTTKFTATKTSIQNR